jgi:D-sedoheptulose 7-phosphate isomerase
MNTDYISELSALLEKIKADSTFGDFIDAAISAMFESFSSGQKVMIAGNGGSAADASHFAAEFVGRYKLERKGFPFLCLSSDTSFLTAWSNDYDFSSIFSRQVETLGKEGDILFLISTSGNSKNLVLAAKSAHDRGIKVISLIGKSGGEVKDLSDILYIVPSDNTPRIQEIHIHAIHTISEILEQKLTQDN